MKKTKLTRSLLAACSIVALTAVMYGCAHDGGSDDTMDTGMEMPEPTPYETAKAAIAAATTAAAAQAAYDAVKDDVTAAEGEKLQAAVDARIVAINTMARATMQRAALTTASGNVDTSSLTTQAEIDAAQTAIDALQMAIDNAADVDDTSMYESQVTTAQMAVNTAQGMIDTDTRRGHQMGALMTTSGTLQRALTALSGATPTQALIDAANMARRELTAAIENAGDLTDAEIAPFQREADNAAAPISTAQTAFDEAEEEAEDTRLAEMAVTAAKLYAGIDAPSATAAAVYDTTDDSLIGVTIGVNAAVNLSLDEDATVADRDGWTGQMFTASPDGDGTYEAVVYSHIGEATVTEGAVFNVAYTLTDGETGDVTSLTGHATSRVASPSFDQDAGEKMFELGENMTRVVLSGSYQGVPGTYYCTPTAGDACGATVADMGFTLGGGTWTFKPTNPAMRLMDTSVPDSNYASYGWWIHKSEDGETFTASAFHAYRGTDPGTVGIGNLRGSATYTGGAAGKYALSSTTGGTNDAGHFTADAMLTATFAEDHTISGTVDNFTGADGMERDWSVALGESTVSDTGVIAGDPETAGNTDPQTTTWTIDGTAGDAAGSWSGDLREQGDDGVPAIATGTFYSEFGREGRMVGAFGANNE